MPRPAKWNAPTESIRLPSHAIAACVRLARALDEPLPAPEADPLVGEYLSFVQNLQPSLVTIQDGAELRRYRVECESLTFEEYQTVCGAIAGFEAQTNGLSADERLYVFSRLVEQVFKPL
jgi:hypothetical protein